MLDFSLTLPFDHCWGDASDKKQYVDTGVHGLHVSRRLHFRVPAESHSSASSSAALAHRTVERSSPFARGSFPLDTHNTPAERVPLRLNHDHREGATPHTRTRTRTHTRAHTGTNTGPHLLLLALRRGHGGFRLLLLRFLLDDRHGDTLCSLPPSPVLVVRTLRSSRRPPPASSLFFSLLSISETFRNDRLFI